MTINKILSGLSLSLIICAGGFFPVSAEDVNSSEAKPDVKVDSPANKPSSSGLFSGKLDGSKDFLSKLPRRLGVMTVDILVGTPVYITRKTKEEILSGITDLVGENRNPLFLLPAATLSVPYGIAGGSISGPLYATANGWKHADDEHFSKEGFGFKPTN